MRRVLLGTTLTIALAVSSGAFAQDSFQPAPPTWTGLYLGANVGYGWGDGDPGVTQSERTRVFRAFGLPGQTLLSDVVSPGVALGGSADVDGWLAGGQAGYNWQTGLWVYGIETDIQWTDQEGDVTACSPAACRTGAHVLTAAYDLDWLGTLRVRGGYLIDPQVLLYATGGLAYGRVDVDYTSGLVGGSSSATSSGGTRAGWVAGGGVEWKLSRTLSLKGEYLYIDLGDLGGSDSSFRTITPNAPGRGLTTVVDTSLTGSSDLTDQIFRIGLNFKLDPAGP